MGFKVVFMIDQINRYYALLRDNLEKNFEVQSNMEIVLGRCL